MLMGIKVGDVMVHWQEGIFVKEQNENDCI